MENNHSFCLRLKEVAQLLNVSLSEVQKLRKKDKSFPAALKFQKNYLQFDKHDIQAWYDKQRGVK
jgi:predicted DNA-binding transcriptional regulator AlpA